MTDGPGLRNARSLYMEGIRDGDYIEAVDRYTGDRYIQHSTPVKDGKEGFIEFFADFIERNPRRDIEIVRAFEDGRYVFLHAVQTLNDGEPRYVTADMFDTDDDGRLVEHWDVIAELHDDPISGPTQVDGPTEPSHLDETTANKQLVRRFVDEVLVTADHARTSELVAADLVQHSSGIADGSDALRAHAEKHALRCVELHKLIGCGDMVATLSETELDGTRHAVIDLYRVDGGRIAEHWDVSEPIGPPDTWVNSGKF